MMMVIFTSLKPSTGAAAEIQRRSQENWRQCFPGVRIITFEGPLVPFREMVEKVEREMDAEFLMYANGDVLFEEGNVLTQRRRPLVNSDFAQIERIDVGERLQLQRTGCVQIPVDSAETEMHITANEPTDNIRVSLSVRPQSMRIQLNCRRYQVKETEYDRFVDTQQQYRKVYTKA